MVSYVLRHISKSYRLEVQLCSTGQDLVFDAWHHRNSKWRRNTLSGFGGVRADITLTLSPCVQRRL